jgi:hypothetical protein
LIGVHRWLSRIVEIRHNPAKPRDRERLNADPSLFHRRSSAAKTLLPEPAKTRPAAVPLRQQYEYTLRQVKKRCKIG